MTFTAIGEEKPIISFRELQNEHIRAKVARDHHEIIREHKLEGCGLERGFLACPICPDCVYCGGDHR